MSKKVMILPGDGIGPEIVAEAKKVLLAIDNKFKLGLKFEEDCIGGAAIDKYGVPLSNARTNVAWVPCINTLCGRELVMSYPQRAG